MKRNIDMYRNTEQNIEAIHRNVSAGKGINWEDYFSAERKITLESAYISIPKPY